MQSIVSILLVALVIDQLCPVYSALDQLGADVSSLPKWEKQGQKYYDASGKETEALTLLKSVGVNYIRIRIWNNPSDGHSGKAEVLALAKEVKSRGMKLMIDFHYSDTWADPGKQAKPAAWASHTIDTLVKDVHDYTLDICNSLKAQGTTPDSVQIGNEINTGMLWPDGKVENNNFHNLGLLIKSGYSAIKECNSGTQVVIQYGNNGEDQDARARWFFDGIKAEGVNYDVIGISYYCFWHGTTTTLQSMLSDLRTRYSKPVWVVETAYPTTADKSNTGSEHCSGFDSTPEGQTKVFNDVASHARSAGATGLFYWEPTWIGERSIFTSAGNINPTFKWTA